MIARVFTYGIGELVSKSLPFILLPIMTHYLSSEDYGTMVFYLSVLSFFLIVVGFSTHGFVSVFGFKTEQCEHKKIITSSLLMIIITYVLVSIGVFFTDTLGLIGGYNIKLILLILLCAALQSVVLIRLVLYRVYSKPMQYVKFQITFSLITASLSIYLVCFTILGWQGRILAVFLSLLLLSSYSIYSFFKLDLLEGRVKSEYLKKEFYFTFPLVVYGLASWCRTSIDKIMLYSLATSSIAGIYSVHFQLASIVLIIVMVLNQATQPELFRILKTKSHKSKEFKKVMYFQLFCVFFISGLFIVIVPFVYGLLIHDDFEFSYTLVSILVLSFLLQGLYFPFFNILLFHEKNKYVSFTGVFVTGIHIFLGVVFIPKFGDLGAALMNLCSAVALLISVIIGCIYFKKDFEVVNETIH
ncbi:lipopolysaccharide biosynthesis protein [Shewanella algae]|uniref:lipopolysaccharide biosynthesis protein n=1 Tax=Shewanella algae TaxID=38313 RepID=UPI001C56095B|nr:oligosaccharide flippase family protein [Shewanella algae]